MFTQPDPAEVIPEATVERRQEPRTAPSCNAYVDVQLPCGETLQARIHDMSGFVGSCLVFDEDPRLEIGCMVDVSYGPVSVSGEVKHAGFVYGEHRVGVLWLND